MKKQIRNWWAGLRLRQKIMFGTAALVLMALTLAAVIGWLRPASAENTVEDAPGSSDQTETGSGNGDVPDAPDPADFEFEVDENGMAVMPVTTDPYEAAAGAAAVAFSIDFSKMSRDEFVDEAISRMTQPSEDYIGPEGEVHTWVVIRPFEEPEMEYLPPAEAIARGVTGAALVEDPERYPWWITVSGTLYEDMALVPELVWRAQPREVLSEDEMREINPGTVGRWGADHDREPDTPGATLMEYFVLSELHQNEEQRSHPQHEYPAAFSIWCDAPADGGLCGVATIRDPEFPASWERQ